MVGGLLSSASSAYSVFAGSDFDVQIALDDAPTKISTVNLADVKSLSNFRPIVASATIMRPELFGGLTSTSSL